QLPRQRNRFFAAPPSNLVSLNCINRPSRSVFWRAASSRRSRTFPCFNFQPSTLNSFPATHSGSSTTVSCPAPILPPLHSRQFLPRCPDLSGLPRPGPETNSFPPHVASYIARSTARAPRTTSRASRAPKSARPAPPESAPPSGSSTTGAQSQMSSSLASGIAAPPELTPPTPNPDSTSPHPESKSAGPPQSLVRSRLFASARPRALLLAPPRSCHTSSQSLRQTHPRARSGTLP